MAHHIVLADDNADIRLVIAGLLERDGFDVVGEADTGREAVDLVRRIHPDVAVLDLSMPDLSGLDAAREIRRICPDTRLVLLTVHVEEHLVVNALRAGFDAYVVKTEAADELSSAIAEVIEGRVFLSTSALAAVRPSPRSTPQTTTDRGRTDRPRSTHSVRAQSCGSRTNRATKGDN